MSYKSYTKSCLAILIFAAFLNGNSSSYAYNSQAIQNYNQAVDFSKNGDFEQAIESFKKSVELDPAFSDAYYNLASLYEFMGKGDLALKYYELAHKHNIKDTESAYKCAIMYFDKKNYSKSSFFLKAIPQSSDKYAQAQALQKKITDIEKQQSANAQQKPVQPATTTAQKPVQTATPTTAQKPAQAPSAQNTPVTSNVAKPVAAATPVKPVDIASTKKTYNNLNSPTGVVKDNKGNLYVADYAGNSIIKIASDGSKSVYSQDNALKGPVGLAIDDFGNIYAACYLSDEIIKITPQGAISVILKGVNKPYYLFLDKSGLLYISEQGSNSVIQVKVL